jgi:hypothetical protein
MSANAALAAIETIAEYIRRGKRTQLDHSSSGKNGYSEDRFQDFECPFNAKKLRLSL